MKAYNVLVKGGIISNVEQTIDDDFTIDHTFKVEHELLSGKV